MRAPSLLPPSVRRAAKKRGHPRLNFALARRLDGSIVSLVPRRPRGREAKMRGEKLCGQRPTNDILAAGSASAKGLARRSGKMRGTPRFSFPVRSLCLSRRGRRKERVRKNQVNADGRRKEILVGIIASTAARSDSWKKNATTVACITILHGARRWTSIVAPSNINNWPCPSPGFRPSLGNPDIFMDRGTVPTRLPTCLLPLSSPASPRLAAPRLPCLPRVSPSSRPPRA